jgi:hypothetical protein
MKVSFQMEVIRKNNMKLNYTGLYVSLLMSCAANGTPTLSELSPDTEAVVSRARTTIMEGKENIPQPSNLQSSPTSKRRHYQKAEQDSGKGNGRAPKSQLDVLAVSNIVIGDEQGQGQLSTQQSYQAAEQTEVKEPTSLQQSGQAAEQTEVKEPTSLWNSAYALDQASMYMESLYKEAQESAELEAKTNYVLQRIESSQHFVERPPYINSWLRELSDKRGLNEPEQKLAAINERIQANPNFADKVAMLQASLWQQSSKIKAEEKKLKAQLAYVLRSIGTSVYAADQAALYIDSLQKQLAALRTPFKAEQELMRFSALLQPLKQEDQLSSVNDAYEEEQTSTALPPLKRKLSRSLDGGMRRASSPQVLPLEQPLPASGRKRALANSEDTLSNSFLMRRLSLSHLDEDADLMNGLPVPRLALQSLRPLSPRKQSPRKQSPRPQ